jgi:DNA-binding LytR/AlgR family response regulator
MFILKTKTGTKSIPFHTIVSCECESRCLICVTEDGQKHTSIMLRVSFDEAIVPLLDDDRFIRPHTSFLVNMDHVIKMIDDYLLMKTGGKVPIAQRKKAQVREDFMEYFFNRGNT